MDPSLHATAAFTGGGGGEDKIVADSALTLMAHAGLLDPQKMDPECGGLSGRRLHLA